jgi:putative transposase
MARKRYKPEEIVAKLRQVDVLVSQGQNRVDAIRQIGVSEVTYYRWRQEFGGLKIDVTGIWLMNVELETKRLELLRELVPGSAPIAILLNPANAQAVGQAQEAQKATRAIGHQVIVLNASTEREIETAFATLPCPLRPSILMMMPRFLRPSLGGQTR